MRPKWCHVLLLLALAVPAVAHGSYSPRFGYVTGPDRATVGLVLRRWVQGIGYRPERGLDVTPAAAPMEAGELATACRKASRRTCRTAREYCSLRSKERPASAAGSR